MNNIEGVWRNRKRGGWAKGLVSVGGEGRRSIPDDDDLNYLSPEEKLN